MKNVFYLLQPLVIITVLLLISTFLLWTNKKVRLAKILVTLSLLLILLFALPFLSVPLLYRLESSVAPIDLTKINSKIDAILVLGGGVIDAQKLPITSKLSSASLPRLVEGVRLWKHFPEAQLILSGGGTSIASEGAVMAELAHELGVDPKKITLEVGSMNTADQAIALAPLLRTKKFILVTSASHMLRSVAAFQSCGCDPIPAPTHHTFTDVEGPQGFSIPKPHASHLLTFERWAYETIGMKNTLRTLNQTDKPATAPAPAPAPASP